MKKRRLDLTAVEIWKIHDQNQENDICCDFCKLNCDKNKDTEHGCLYHNAAAHMPFVWLDEEIEI